jgi:hypothetical protein
MGARARSPSTSYTSYTRLSAVCAARGPARGDGGAEHYSTFYPVRRYRRPCHVRRH